jgi:hypothetical protein
VSGPREGNTAPLSAERHIVFQVAIGERTTASRVHAGVYRGRHVHRSPLPILARDLHCLDHRILDAAMAKLARLVAFLLFIGSVGISIALMLHGSEWSEARASTMQDIRSVMTGVAFVLFCIFMFTGKKRRRPRRYRPET